jgi:flagellar hook-associated protein 2
MAISSAGIGSGLDVQSLVSQLVATERAPAESRLNTQETRTRSTLSALGAFKSALATLQDSVAALTGRTTGLSQMTTTSSKPELFTATTATGAQPGNFGVEVLALAQAGKIASAPYASSSAVVGTGTVTIGVGSDSFSVTLGATGNTLAALRDKINQASDNPGVTATLLNESGGTRLILTSRETGIANELSFSSAATADGASFVSTSVLQPAADASIEIDGFAYTSASNTVTGAIDGVTLKLLKAEPGTVGAIDMAADSAASTSAIKAFVDAYNAVMDVMAKHGKFDAATKTAGPLLGEGSVRNAMIQMRAVLNDSVEGGALTVLSQLGITTQTDGKFKLDTTVLDQALAKDPRAVRQLFGGTEGYATRMDTVLDDVLESEGRLAAGHKGLEARLERLDDERDRLDRRMAMIQARYLRQFTALDAMMGKSSATSGFLSQQLANLPGSGS